MTITPADARYEPHVRPVPPTVRREAAVWQWNGWDVHVEHIGETDAPVRMVLVHGAGGNAAAMWPFAAHLSTLGARVTTFDMPGYGRTSPARSRHATHADWQQVLLDLIAHERDPRPLVLMGASMGGMLALDAAATVPDDVAHVVVTSLLDLSRSDVRIAVMRAPWLARLAPLLRLARGPIAAVPLAMRLLAPMERIANRDGLTREVLSDRRGGRTSMPLGWFRTLIAAGPAVAPEDITAPPVLLLHPSDDRWTPPSLSSDVLERIAAPTRAVMLPGCGHFPVEEPGFQLLLDEVAAVISGCRPAETTAQNSVPRTPPMIHPPADSPPKDVPCTR